MVLALLRGAVDLPAQLVDLGGRHRPLLAVVAGDGVEHLLLLVVGLGALQEVLVAPERHQHRVDLALFEAHAYLRRCSWTLPSAVVVDVASLKPLARAALRTT